MEYAKELLINKIINFSAFENIICAIVFDAKLEQTKIETISKNTTIIYTKQGITADAYIENYICELKENNKATVVTNDILLRDISTGFGALWISAASFKEMLDSCEKKINHALETKNRRKFDGKINLK